MTDFDTAFAANPLIAILRGLRPPEAADTALTLTGAAPASGIRSSSTGT